MCAWSGGRDKWLCWGGTRPGGPASDNRRLRQQEARPKPRRARARGGPPNSVPAGRRRLRSVPVLRFKGSVRFRPGLDHATRRRDGLIEALAEYEIPIGDASAPAEDVEAIRGKPIRLALVILAERNDGILESRTARQSLEAAGQHVSPNRLWKEIALVRRFKKTGHGVYRLLPATPETGTLF